MLKLENISKRIGSSDYLLNNVSLSLEPGSITGIISLEPAETTTLQKVISGNEQATAGSVTVNSRRLKTFRLNKYPPEIAFSFGPESLSPNLSVLDNLLLGNSKFSFGTFFTARGLKAKAITLFERFATQPVWNQKVSTCSQEFKTLLAIIRILLQDVDYYLMDRILENISLDNFNVFKSLCLELKQQQKAILLAPNDINHIFELCDYVIALRNGKVVYNGATSSITLHNLRNMMNNTEYAMNLTITNTFNNFEKTIISYDKLVSESLKFLGSFGLCQNLFCCYYTENNGSKVQFIDSFQFDIKGKIKAETAAFFEQAEEGSDTTFSVAIGSHTATLAKVSHNNKLYALLGHFTPPSECQAIMKKVLQEFSECFYNIETISDKRKEFDKLNLELDKKRGQLAEYTKILEESKQRYQNLIETINELIWEVDAKGRFIYVSPKFEERLGYPEAELLHRPPLIFYPEEDQEEAIKEFHDTLKAQKPFSDMVRRHVHKDGHYVYMEISGVPVFDDSGTLTGYRGISRDITERIKAEQDLREREENLRITLDSIGDAVITTDKDGKVIRINPVASELTGWSQEEAHGRQLDTIFKIFNSQTNQPIENPLHEVMKRKAVTSLQSNTMLISRDGKKYMISDSAAPIKREDNETQGLVLVFRDETENLRKEQQFIQIQKLDAVGSLAGGIAHDFNNVLTGITGPLSLIESKIKRQKPFTEKQQLDKLAIIRLSAERATDMVKQLLTLSRKQELSFAPLDLNSSVKHVYKLAKNTLDKSVKIHVQYHPGQAMVLADPTQIEQTILNLFINASHAMTSMREENQQWGGSLDVSIDKIHADERFIEAHTGLTPGYFWALSISDTGVGISKKNQEKIFDPFFTTKLQGQGTGLGLSMVYSIIQQHHGFINVYSEEDVGTTVNIYLPVLERDTETAESEEEYALPPQGKGLILIIDDEFIVRNTAKEILEDCGYNVIISENSMEGVEMFAQQHREINLVLLDMVMPILSGKEVFQKLLEIDPNVNVLLASGFKQDERVQEILNMGVKGFIQKPYDLDKLANAVKEYIRS